MAKDRQVTFEEISGLGVSESIPSYQLGGGPSMGTRPHLSRATGIAKTLCDNITKMYHSYTPPSPDRGGRAMDYLISLNKETVGTIGFAFIGVRLNWSIRRDFALGWAHGWDKENIAKLKRVACCFRYTLKPGVPKNFASQSLSVALRLIKKDWNLKYGHDLLGVVTFVKPPKLGSCFKACGFKVIGYTSGLEFVQSADHQTENVIGKGTELRILSYHYPSR